ncbi:MAG: hypothetical protein AAGF12_35970 [Myxococcota bacterium]
MFLWASPLSAQDVADAEPSEEEAMTEDGVAEEPGEDATDSVADRPWAEGVAESRQRAALRLFGSGNTHFGNNDYGNARRDYVDALAAWDHPAIHGNLAVVLVHLDRVLEAYAHIQDALRYGADPFEAHVHQQLRTTERLLRAQITKVVIACEEPGAVVRLNGEPVFEGPGQTERFVPAGEHQLVAEKPGYLTYAEPLVALPGADTIVHVELVPLSEAGELWRPIAPWVPWTVLGGGVVIVGIGVILQALAADNADDFEAEIARQCPDGCDRSELPEAVLDLETSSSVQNGVAIGAFAVGAVTIITGAALLILNQPRRVLEPETEGGTDPELSVSVGSDRMGLQLQGQF